MHGPKDDLATLAAIGVLAAIAAALGHEALGHAGACLATGGEVTLLTAIWFRCSPGSTLVNAAGPFGGLLVSLAGLALAGLSPRSATRLRLLGLLLGSFAGFWFCAQLTNQVLLGRDDWSYAAGWPIKRRILVAAAGVAGYGLLIRLIWRLASLIAGGRADQRRFLVPHAAGALAQILCAALRPNDGSAAEMALAVGVAPLGYVWAVTRPLRFSTGTEPLARSWTWVVIGLAALTIYAAVLGRGVGSLA
jgi:hypothetical protein